MKIAEPRGLMKKFIVVLYGKLRLCSWYLTELFSMSKSEMPQRGSIQDINHRVWVLQDQILIAVPRKDRVSPVTIALISCRHVETLEKDRGNPIYLGLNGLNLCLMCAKAGDQPTLQLKPEWQELHLRVCGLPWLVHRCQL
ncbi:interleukin-36 alpha isoform X4 [Piliocolobus tephrosceles]|uniref:interleukin-36 alpha isoform X4 n=1 Tax=Piliocolobus tephrosceles TaxID=591936 RepID=UPI000E6B3E37|nr:interleukin-36 alpha isoform X4 [Piliocolobus tephrosceles]